MNTKPLKDIARAFFCILATASLTANAASTIERSLVRVGRALAVEVNVVPESVVAVYAVEETIPANTTVSEVGGGGSVDTSGGKIKWGPFFDNTARMVSYKLEASEVFEGVIVFSGIASFDGAPLNIGGASEIAIQAAPPRHRK